MIGVSGTVPPDIVILLDIWIALDVILFERRSLAVYVLFLVTCVLSEVIRGQSQQPYRVT